MRYLITGHTGFKGAWLSSILKAQGHEVVGISLPPLESSLYEQASLSSMFSGEKFIDIRNREDFTRAIQESNTQVAFHLAAQPLVRESYKTPIETYATNVMGTLNFLEGVKKSEIAAAVVITTDKVYKNKNLLRGYTEADELGGYDPYSSSKAAADIATQSWISSFDANNVVIARAGNVVGGGDWGVDRLIPDLVSSFNNGTPAKIRYPEAIRPWQHVLDCLAGYISLSEKMLSDGVSGAWNFGPEIAVENTVARVADLAAKNWGGSAGWEKDLDPNPHEAGYLLLDSTKARAELGWHDPLDFSSTIEWTMEFYKAVIQGSSSRDLLENQVSRYLALG
jgi:CDP-glucose 4,6-dehydratase